MSEAVREQWLEERRKGIGGSDSPVILGVSPFRTPRDLWMEKRGLIDGEAESRAMTRGRVLEPIAADIYQQETGRAIASMGPMVHPNLEWMRANVDRLVSDREDGKVGVGVNLGVLEIKCPGLSIFSKIRREGLPDYYQIQLQHYLAVTGCQWGAFAVFNSELWELIHFDIPRDDELISLIIEKDAAFWESIQSGEIPEDERPVVNLPPTNASEIVKFSSAEWDRAVRSLKEARDILKEAEAFEEQASEAVKSLMGDAQVAEGGGARIYYKWANEGSTFNKKALAKAHPEIDLAKFEKPKKASRRFTPYFIERS